VVAKKWAVARVLDDVERTRDRALGIVPADFSPLLRDRSSVFFAEEFRSVGELR
jgi:hypothetical protein